MKYILLLLLSSSFLQAEDTTTVIPDSVKPIMDDYQHQRDELTAKYNKAQADLEASTIKKLDAKINALELAGNDKDAGPIQDLKDSLVMSHAQAQYPQLLKGNWRLTGPDNYDATLAINADGSVEANDSTGQRFGKWEVNKDGFDIIILQDGQPNNTLHFLLVSPTHIVSGEYSGVKIKERQW
jgi:hypothetical protein